MTSVRLVLRRNTIRCLRFVRKSNPPLCRKERGKEGDSDRPSLTPARNCQERTDECVRPYVDLWLHGIGPFRLYIGDADDEALAKRSRCPRDGIQGD